MSDSHKWTNWEGYKLIHDNQMLQHPFVREDLLFWEEIAQEEASPDAPPHEFMLSGDIICEQGVIVHVKKVLETQLGRSGEIQVRGRHSVPITHIAPRVGLFCGTTTLIGGKMINSIGTNTMPTVT